MSWLVRLLLVASRCLRFGGGSGSFRFCQWEACDQVCFHPRPCRRCRSPRLRVGHGVVALVTLMSPLPQIAQRKARKSDVISPPCIL